MLGPQADFAPTLPDTDRASVIGHERIVGYKVPKQIDLHLDPLPKSGPGKIRE